MRSLLLPAALVVLCAACAKTVDTPAELVATQPSGTGETMLPDPDAQGGHVGRAPRRITVAQLKQSILITTGQQWTQIDTLAPSLGQADFALVNVESTEPNLVFTKFLEDGAREVCVKAASADLLATTPPARVLARKLPTDLTDLTKLDDASIRDNLVYLSTRFWGEPLHDAELDSWAGFFKTAAARAQTIKDRKQALAVTCVALMTDPRFFTY